MFLTFPIRVSERQSQKRKSRRKLFLPRYVLLQTMDSCSDIEDYTMGKEGKRERGKERGRKPWRSNPHESNKSTKIRGKSGLGDTMRS